MNVASAASLRDQRPEDTASHARYQNAVVSRALSELWTRFGSACVLAAAAIGLTYVGLWSFVVLVAVGVAILCWEWGMLVRHEMFSAATIVHAGCILAAIVLTVLGQPYLAAGLLVLGALLVAWFAKGDPWSIAGVAYFGLPALSLVLIRSDPSFGTAAIFFLFGIVWIADTSAYACGRLIGGPKLAPRISPKKTWVGLFGAVLIPALLTLVGAMWLGITGAAALAIVGLGLALVSQIGDLVESATKRIFGRKDASDLIPGHGGLLDRVDAFIFASVAAGILAIIRDFSHPGQALVIWP